MRERTPSADDTPKRAPPAPPREAASADVAGSKTSSDAAEAFRASKFSPTAAASSTGSLSLSVDARMVASTHNLDDLGVSHPTSASSDRQQQQEKHGHTYRSAQTAQDKRSRLSNVINNLRKKVPDSRNGDSPKKEEDDRNSVERNLETLEKYVMTVLNGVIKDEEDDDKEVSRKKEAEKGKEPEKLTEDQEDEDSKGPAAKFEPSKPNESRTEAAVFLSDQSGKSEAKASCLDQQKLASKTENSLRNEEPGYFEPNDSLDDLSDRRINEEREASKVEKVEEEEACRGSKYSSKETKSEEQPVVEALRNDAQEEEKKENRSLGTIIMERLSENQSDEKASVDTGREDGREFVHDNVGLRNVCRDLLNDLLNGINQLIDENRQDKEEARNLDNSAEESRDTRSQDLAMTSLHCSLPLDKVASVLQNCQTSEMTTPQSPFPSPSSSQGSKSPSKPSSPTVRHLCLYCDRKFMSISLRQRHTERVHQQGGGRRSERNSRKSTQNCQYCSDKCTESLEGLFQHMVGSHGDKYHACLQCSTRYLTREALVGHMSEHHGVSIERNPQIQEKTKEPSPCKELGNQSPRDRTDPSQSPKERRSEESDHEYRAESILLKPMLQMKDNFSNPGSPEFDSSFYSSVSCNIRENLLHHLDGKLQTSSSTITSASSMVDSKPQQLQQQQSFYEHNVNQIQFPIDISLTAATPVYSKEYSSEEYENNSEYAQKPGKSNKSYPRRVSFEKYNFPRKYDGKEQWTCSIKDLSKFDISTQLFLRKKQQLLKEHFSLNRLHQIPILRPTETTDIIQDEHSLSSRSLDESDTVDEALAEADSPDVDQILRYEGQKLTEGKSDEVKSSSSSSSSQSTEFSTEFGNFLRLRKWDENTSIEAAKKQEVVYAELTGEWSRPRVYICGACASKHVTLRELEDHKVTSHPNVWCSHFEFSGDQRELYKHLFLPGKDMPTAKARTAILVEKVCTKCSKNCSTLPELHRHMLECGGDQAWLLGLFGNGKKKYKWKWRPFGSRSRRRRQRGMKRNIQNSQTPRVNTPKEKQPTGPRVRPSDRETIEKMLANLPPKRATRKVLQDSTLRTQGRLRNVQTRTRQRMENSSASRMSRNKAALRNKLLKNAKSIQRNRCRIDNISAVIESVVRNYSPDDRKLEDEGNDSGERAVAEKETKEKPTEGSASAKEDAVLDGRNSRTKMVRGPRVLGKKRNVKTKEGPVKSLNYVKKPAGLKGKAKAAMKNLSEAKTEAYSETVKVLKSAKVSPKSTEKVVDTDEIETSSGDSKSSNLAIKNKSLAQITPKRKRPVDPVASLNASIKAKSQLRTQDGKFARNPNKEFSSPQKYSEVRYPGSNRSAMRSNETSPELSMTRSKLRTVSRLKNADQLPKRTTRLSSDSDKMPTLEPAVQVPSDTEEFTETSTNDLPILSPATPASSSDKILRGKSLINKCSNLEDKESGKKVENEGAGEKTEAGNSLQEEDKEQKQGKGRRFKNEAKNPDKSLETVVAKADGFKEGVKGVTKEKFKRKSAPARMLSLDERRGTMRGTEDTSARKELRKREEGKLETRSNVKAKLEKVLDNDEPIKIQSVPFEVKKLIGSDSKEDLLTKLALTSRIATSKRCLRQTVPKLRPDQGKGKFRRDPELEKAKRDSGSTSDASTKKEKFDARRKSLRKCDKKVTSEVKTSIRRRRCNSLSNDSKSTISPTQMTSDGQSKAETEAAVQNVDKRQTRGSLLNSTEVEAQVELVDLSLKKNTLGKRRGRIKSSTDTTDKKNVEASQARSEETDRSSFVDNVNSEEQRKENALHEETGEKLTKNEKEQSRDADTSRSNETSKPSVNLNHLQMETSNSMDSGKENSLEAPAPVQKLKVGRPRKSWGPRKEKTPKRSLNNVIGILTEGKNIPVENQQSVLSMQTTMDDVNPAESPQNNPLQSDDSSNRSQNLGKSNKSSENNVSEATSSADEPIKEAAGVQKISADDSRQSEASETTSRISQAEKHQKVESSARDTKEQSPATDIILDLSRRKPKGKGSFLEKIVSKIAKQKDALLEGDVGSLLDTAADELTSILDEVGPAFPEGTENLGETRNKLQAEKMQDAGQETVKGSISESCSNTTTRSSSGRSLASKETRAESEEKVISREGRSKENSEADEIKNDRPDGPSSESDKRIKTKLSNGNRDTDECSSSKVQKEGCAKDSKVEEQVVSVGTNSVPNGILFPVAESVSEPPAINSAEVCLETREEEATLEEAKTKRRSKKRSLEENSPKKSKRKSVESSGNNYEESLISEELRLADVMELIEKSKQVPSTKENLSTDAKPESIKCEEERTSDKLVISSEENSEKDVNTVKKEKTEDQSVNIARSRDEIRVNSEEKSSVSMRIIGKRKSHVETLDQYQGLESSVRRSSKRKSLQEEKLSQSSEEETASKMDAKDPSVEEAALENDKGSRRRSYRTKSMIQSRNDEEAAKESEIDPVLGIGNISSAEDPELSLKDLTEKRETSKEETSETQPRSTSVPEEQKTINSNACVENVESQAQSTEEVTQNATIADSKEPEQTENAVPLKIPKKRGRKKKCLTVDQTQTQENSKTEIQASVNQLPPRRSLRTNRFAENIEDSSKNTDQTDPQVSSTSLEPFKVPEVTEVLQHTKKRTYKRRSIIDDNLDAQNNCPAAPEISNSVEYSDASKNSMEKEEQSEASSQKDSSDGRKLSYRGANRDQLDLERSSSSGSIDLAQSNRTRSSRRKQLSSEDLSGQESLNQRAESTDNLSETSCVSESSYFRKKRFSKKRKEFQKPPEDVQTDASITDSESVDTEQNTDRRQSLKRRAKKNISFVDEYYMEDDFDISMVIQECLLRESTVENNSNVESKPEPPIVEDKLVKEDPPKETPNQEPEEETAKDEEEVTEDPKKSIVEEEDDEDDDEEEEELRDEEKVDSLSQSQDDFQTPKKRTAGNYVVVHKKTGEILIVEKRKKLTKEAARFFCDICATSFTRKSSLKKHNQSQSHLLQMIKAKRDEYFLGDTENIEDACNASRNEASSDENRSLPDETMNVSLESEDDPKEADPSEPVVDQKDQQSVHDDSRYTEHLEQDSLIDTQQQQRILEDELLDEEICKITENMSHDEYVLTDHVSPEPESTSTPIKMETKKLDEIGKKKKHEKKKDKVKKKSLADEQIVLDSPQLETPADSTLVTLSIKMANSSETNLGDNGVSKDSSIVDDSGSTNEVPVARDNDFQQEETHTKMTDALLETEVDETKHDTTYELNSEEKTETFSRASLDIKDAEENQPQERVTLKLTINKRSIEACKEDDAEANRNFKLNYPNTTINESEDANCNSEKSSDAPIELIKDCNYSKKEIDRFDLDMSSNLSVNLRKRNRSVEDSTVCEERNLEEEKPDNTDDRQTLTIDDEIQTEKESESVKPTRHGKPKKGRPRKHQDAVENNTEDRVATSCSKFNSDQAKSPFDEVLTPPDLASDEKPVELDEIECFVPEARLEDNSERNNFVTILEKAESDDEFESSGLEIVEDQETSKSYSESESTEETVLKEPTMQQRVSEERIESPEGKIGPSLCMDDDEASSSSSLADKPLSQVLLENEEKMETYKKRTGEQESSTNFPEDSDDEPKLEKSREVEDIGFKSNELNLDENSSDNRKELSSEETKLQIASDDECDPETLKATKDSDKESKISSESENSEAVSSLKSTSNDKESYDTIETKAIGNSHKTSANDRQNSSKRVSRVYKCSNKDSHKRSRGKKPFARNKIVDLISESDDSDSEDKIESQNKSKIVKSVFGRVFGGEKVDKVKEVLNDWVSKSEDDSDASRTDFRSSSPGEVKTKESSEDRSLKRHAISSSMPPGLKKRPGRRPKKSSSMDRAKDKKQTPENHEGHRPGKHTKSKYSSSTRRKHDADASDGHLSLLPTTKCRPSKKRAEELISRTFEEEASYGLRNQGKPDLSVKDSGYGSFNCDEDSSKLVPLEDPAEDDQRVTKRRKSSASRRSKSKTEEEDWKDLLLDKKISKNTKESGNEEDCSVKDLSQRESPTIGLSVDLESSRSCSSLGPSTIRNRSLSMDRNSQSTRDSNIDEEEDEDMEDRRISPLFVCEATRSSVDSSTNSENEEEPAAANETPSRKRSSSEFSGEKIVIRSPLSTHKSEVVTIAPTDAIEDNALDVPQEIEPTKPRQGKVLNFDEELFVECCSRLKATTENELRGAKKIKLDHNESYHRKDDQQQGFRGPRDRWRDVESQNSLGSLLESVNQLLGEEMYSTRERDYPKRNSRNPRSEQSSRSASPDVSRVDNLGYEDSLDVAFEHNNKLRDKIQQRMRESESLIASTFGQKNGNELLNGVHGSKNHEQEILRNSYGNPQDQRHLPAANLSNGGYNDTLHVRDLQGSQNAGKLALDPSGLKSKMNSSLGGLLDKALSNLLHSNEKHDHNGSTPMKVLAELACARAPTSTAGEPAPREVVQPAKITLTKDSVPDPIIMPKDVQKKSRNPIKELFERKKEMNDRKQQEKSKTEAALRELNVHRQRKAKRMKKHQDFPLIRRSEHGGLAERKKRRDGFDRKDEFVSSRIKDVYEFDEEESQAEPNLGTVMSYRSRPGYEVSCLKTKEVDVAGLMSKAIGDSLENGKTGDALSTRLESMIDKKFKELEKFAPKTKGALKSFQSEDQQRPVITGPMDEFVERKPPKGKRTVESSLKHPKLKKRSKNLKKKARNAWYENDSSDEYRTAVKAEDVGVGISKSQRTCSKGKQNIFAELYTSSESEFEVGDVDYESRRQRRAKKTTKKVAKLENAEQGQELTTKYCSENEDNPPDWTSHDLKDDEAKHDCDNKKSESEMSDHPLVIDERKDMDEQKNSDDETENQYERNFEMDDLYREDSSIVDSDMEDLVPTERPNVPEEPRTKSPSLPREKTETKTDYMQENELIPLEEALDILDQADNEAHLETNYGNLNRATKTADHINNLTVVTAEPEKDTFHPIDEPTVKSPTPAEEQEEEPDNDLLALPEKLTSNEKPQKESENLPLHVFLSRKVQESKKRKEQQLKKMQEEQERILMDFQPTRRQRKCAIGKQGLLAEISSSDEEIVNPRERRTSDRSDHEKQRKQKRESKEKRKERYIEKKHEQMIAKEQKAIEEEILREVGKKKESFAHNTSNPKTDVNGTNEPESIETNENNVAQEPTQKKKHQAKEKQKKQNKDDDPYAKSSVEGLSDLENTCNKSETNHESENNQDCPAKQKKHSKSPTKPKKTPKSETKVTTTGKKSKSSNGDRRNRTDSKGSKDKERRSSSGKRDSDDEELKTTKSWNKVEEGVGVAIGRRKRAAANQLYYWSSSSDEEEMLEVVPAVEEEEDDRQEQHGWIVGDSHKRMITMLAMEKQLKEKRRRSEDEFEPGRAKSKKHRNSTS
ncbi:uncharacterized protein LOC143426607 [Xylocopa sonorina]|uniref:uncharacterized protein LOC143426607 n=1 Tax=Xylocopa sonorina TaxID=1818115 RepID=UPI00403AC6EE